MAGLGNMTDADNTAKLLVPATKDATLYNEYLTKGDFVVQVDTEDACAAGCEFYQTPTGAVLCSNMDIPLQAIVTIYDPFNSFPVYTREERHRQREVYFKHTAPPTKRPADDLTSAAPTDAAQASSSSSSSTAQSLP